jgi:hypothetical protein
MISLVTGTIPAIDEMTKAVARMISSIDETIPLVTEMAKIIHFSLK